MKVGKKRDFDPETFLATIGEGRAILPFQKKQTIFAQGNAADAVFYIQEGKVKLTVVSSDGKEATIGILSENAFFGEGCLAGQQLRMASATAMTDCDLLLLRKRR
jgi:CRP/FNR family cyclic AMP-dependent transcriptional regulator